MSNRTICASCRKPQATDEDYRQIPEGAGSHLCWSQWGTPCEVATYTQGRADERAAIVAWLRAGGTAPRDATRWPCDDFANAIERGEHELKKP